MVRLSCVPFNQRQPHRQQVQLLFAEQSLCPLYKLAVILRKAELADISHALPARGLRLGKSVLGLIVHKEACKAEADFSVRKAAISVLQIRVISALKELGVTNALKADFSLHPVVFNLHPADFNVPKAGINAPKAEDINAEPEESRLADIVLVLLQFTTPALVLRHLVKAAAGRLVHLAEPPAGTVPVAHLVKAAHPVLAATAAHLALAGTALHVQAVHPLQVVAALHSRCLKHLQQAAKKRLVARAKKKKNTKLGAVVWPRKKNFVAVAKPKVVMARMSS